MPPVDSSVDPAVKHEFCSYCERKTDRWCPECYGCPACCQTGVHCERCGQSQTMCNLTACGGDPATAR